jgi:hypothetical protein
MSMHPWTSHDIAHLRHQEHVVRAESANAARELATVNRNRRSEERRTKAEGLLGSVQRRLVNAMALRPS